VSGLWLKRNPIGAGGLRAVARLVRVGGAVRVLDLVNAFPGEPGWVEVVEALTDAPNGVERLYLGGNGLGAEAGAPLARLVATNQGLRGLFLNVNRLGEGAVRFAEGLKANRGLADLGLGSNGLGPTGVATLARALCGHPGLTWLDLGYSPSTRVLGCSANRIEGEAVPALAELIASAPRLAELNLTRAGIDTAGVARLAPAAERNPALVRVDYDGPRIAALERLLAGRQGASAARHRPDVSLIRSVYR
jgi:Ran GTPase-activating protein (RanGAP) involved in mRNA processing and transport